MNKGELLSAMAEESGLSKTDCEKALEAFKSVVARVLKSGGKIALVGFGSFYTVLRKATTGRNPQTGEQIQISASTQPKFKAGADLKKAVN